MIYFLNDWLIGTTLFVSRHWVAVATMTAKSVWPIKSNAPFTRSATLWTLDSLFNAWWVCAGGG